MPKVATWVVPGCQRGQSRSWGKCGDLVAIYGHEGNICSREWQRASPPMSSVRQRPQGKPRRRADTLGMRNESGELPRPPWDWPRSTGPSGCGVSGRVSGQSVMGVCGTWGNGVPTEAWSCLAS